MRARTIFRITEAWLTKKRQKRIKNPSPKKRKAESVSINMNHGLPNVSPLVPDAGKITSPKKKVVFSGHSIAIRTRAITRSEKHSQMASLGPDYLDIEINDEDISFSLINRRRVKRFLLVIQEYFKLRKPLSKCLTIR